MDKFITVMGIDPGTNTGVSILTVDISNDYKIINLMSFTFNLKQLSKNSEEFIDRLQELNKLVISLNKDFEPAAIGMEAAFINMKYPKAVTTLTQYTTTIEIALSNFDQQVKLYKYPPKLVKQRLGNANADKEDMKENIKKIKELKPFITNEMTEHEIDATAIAYITVEEIKKFPYYLLAV